MDISLIKTMPDYLVKALCSTLIHSLWQGLLLAAVAGIVMMCTRRSSAVLRYNLLLADLGLFACAVLLTFVWQANNQQKGPAMFAVQEAPHYDQALIAQQLPVKTNDYKLVLGFLAAHSNSIVLVWFLIVMARTLQLLTGLQSLYFLRRRHIAAISHEWEARVKELAIQLGIKRLVGIAESGMAKVPMVIGHLKPLILIPAGLISALPPSGIEAILVHELAHIRRRDYLMNLLVSVLEIMLFFNPAVLWIASLIRAERENCCDDIAVAHTNSKVDYIKALVTCQEYQLAAPAYAMAFSSRKDHLMGRVKRMLYNSNSSLNIMERSLLGICLLSAVLFTTAFSNADKINKLVIKIVHSHKTTTVSYQQTTTKKDEGTPQPVAILPKARQPLAPKYTTTMPDTGILRIYRPDQVGEHTNMLFVNGGQQTHLVKIDGTLYQVNGTQGQISSLQVNGKTILPGDYAPYLSIINEAANKKLNTPLTPIARQADPVTPIKEPVTPITPVKTSLGGLKAGLGDLHQTAYSAYANSYKSAGAKYVPADAYPANYKAYHDDTNRKKLTNDLIADGIIKTPDELASFKLSDTEFIVNGKKMPDDIYQKFKKAYVKMPESGKQGSWSWLYNYTVQ